MSNFRESRQGQSRAAFCRIESSDPLCHTILMSPGGHAGITDSSSCFEYGNTGSTGLCRLMSRVCRQERAYRDADDMIDAFLGRRRSKVEHQRLEHGGLAGIKKLRCGDLDIGDREMAGRDLVLEIAVEPRDAGGGPGLVELLADRRHALRDADHSAQRRLPAGPA